MTDANSARTKVYTHGERPDVRVPFTQVHLKRLPRPDGPTAQRTVSPVRHLRPGRRPRAGLAGAACGLGAGSG